jgi:ribosome-associated protein
MPPADEIQVTPRLSIPLGEIEVRASRSSGPGGQHANKTATRIEAVFDVEASATLSPEQKHRIRQRHGARVTAVAQDARSQSRNRELALERLAARIAGGLHRPKSRQPTRPGRAAKERRLGAKRRRGETKRLRRPPDSE